MYIKIFLNYILGYLNIEIEGYFVEKFINTCIAKNIFLWNIKRTKSTLVYCNIGISNFKKVRKIAKNSKCRIKIKNKKGLPFIFNKYKKRKIFFIFLFILTVSIISLSNFVWNIDVTGNVNIPKEELIRNLEKEGLKVGKLKGKINAKEIISKMRLERNDLAWIGIELKGTNAIVKIVEADKKPDIINEEEYCNIVATKPGIIVKVDALNGTPLVKEGDTIKEGTILVGGWLEGKYTGIRYVHANADVKAKVWYSQKEKIELKQVKSKQTGNKENKYSVKINNFKINFYKTLSKFKKYDTIEENKKIKLFSDFYLPIEILKKTNCEYIEENIEYSIEEAKEIGVKKAQEALDNQVQNKENMINTYINYNEQEEFVEVEVTYEVLEEIGTKEKIVF
ncbi:MAG: sporulation protein YqfD [Clostridia bacterium]|nr:sporulation protein YqfD [Clostridia bacterium]